MKLGMVLLGAVALTGCGVSLQPFYTTANLSDDSSLEGTWSDEDSTWQVKHTGFAQYTIATCDTRTSSCTEDTVATLFRIDGQLFLDFQEKSKDFFSDAIRPHGLFEVRLPSASSVELTLLDADHLNTLSEGGLLPVDHVLLEDRLLLTASASQMQAFLSKHLSDSQVFAEPHILGRN